MASMVVSGVLWLFNAASVSVSAASLSSLACSISIVGRQAITAGSHDRNKSLCLQVWDEIQNLPLTALFSG